MIRGIENARSTLIFTNVRSATEIWYRALLDARPDWAGQIALHHGSLEREVRDWVEDGLRTQRLRAVVCTSSLDLGVDYSPVDQVLQIGSPKGVARLLQRAGRSGHQPGAVRNHRRATRALELVEAAAARGRRRATHHRASHCSFARCPRPASSPARSAAASRRTTCCAKSDDARVLRAVGRQWQWALDFVVHGGASLNAYPEYRRVVIGDDGIAHVPDRQIARRHRAQIGTIVSDASIVVQLRNGRRLGHVEESFIARLKPGDAFVFAGRVLEFLRVREMTAWVRLAPPKAAISSRAGSAHEDAAVDVAVQRTAADRGRQARRLRFTRARRLVRPLLEFAAALVGVAR